MKKIVISLVLILGVTSIALAENRVIRGTVEGIAEDGSYIIVAGEKVMSDQETLEDFFIEPGDEAAVTVEDADGAAVLIDLEYIFEEFESDS